MESSNQSPIKEYKKTLKNGTYALRLGTEVPEGDVNLAYIHAPKVQVEDNVALTDLSYVSDNVIPQDQLVSMVAANHQGELEYVDIVGDGEVRPRPPRETFPSEQVSLTRKFKKNHLRTENALFYKFELHYHYDSKTATPDSDGTYPLEKYTGQQIELTDENGNLVDDRHKYDIYVQAHEENPRIYSVYVYLHQNTNRTETFKVRYNHVDAVVPDADMVSVRQQIEFYTDSENTVRVGDRHKHMLEGGKLRIINGESAYTKVSEADVQQAILEGSEEDIFAVVPKPNGEGYRLIVPQKAEADPRVPTIFSHRIVAQYTGTDGQTVKVSVGHITDWCINPEALLPREREDYTGEWKNIGIPSGVGKHNAKDMIELSLPFGTPGIPSDATFFIEDDQGNLLYHVKQLRDNPHVDTHINPNMSHTAEAKSKREKQAPWSNAMQANTVVKNNPIRHVCSVIPERQQTKWNFQWKADGEGYTERTTNYKTNWQVCADVGFQKTLVPHPIDVLDKNKWSTLGQGASVNHWQYGYVPELKKNGIHYLQHATDVMGFYQRQAVLEDTPVNLMNQQDYIFSTKVRITDPVDDDAIGIAFRVRDAQNYYLFAWEKDSISTTNKTYEFDHGEGIKGSTHGCDRVVLNQYGMDMLHFDPAGAASENWKWTNNRNTYLARGMGSKHKRIYKATPSALSSFPSGSPESAWNGATRYPNDKTNCAFTDITMTESYSAKGWEYGKDYKITVVVTNDWFRVYINDADSRGFGQLVCQAKDNTHTQGTYGMVTMSQRWAHWYDVEMTQIVMDTVCTEKKEIILTSTVEKKLSNYTVTDMLQVLIDEEAKERFQGAPYEVFAYTPKSDGAFTLRIDERDDFLYGKTDSPDAGAVIRTPWKTEDNGLTVEGVGEVEYHADGHFTIITSPSILPTEHIPGDVLAFQWKAPRITQGENIQVSLVPPNQLQFVASVPPIRPIGRPYVLEEQMILQSDGFQHLAYLLNEAGEAGFYDALEIPTDVPKEELMLRLERGKVTGVLPDGTAITENPEYRVNYRFRTQKDGFTRLPVDQFQDQLGVNRLRLNSILTESGEWDPTMTTDILAWTTFQELEAAPLFAVKIEEERKIQMEKPKVESDHVEWDNWYVRIKNGHFLKRISLPTYDARSGAKLPEVYVAYPELIEMAGEEVDLEYRLPEYTNQAFYNRPSVVVDKEKPVLLNEYSLQTKHAPLVVTSTAGHAYLEVYSLRGGTRRHLRVADVDTVKGVIYLHDRIREQDEVFIRYAYREDWYTYRGFEQAGHFFHLDLNPTVGHQHTIATNGLHRWIPIITEQASYEVQEVPNAELLVKHIHVYLRPACIRSIAPDGSLSSVGPIIPGTNRQQTIFHTDGEWWFHPKDYRYDPTMLRLGKVTLQANANMDEHMTILDTRTRGGGLDESLSQEIIAQVNKESLYHWDIGYFDGAAYQENGVMVIRLPRHILQSEENPHGFHESDVQAAVAKHKAYGALPIIEYYEEGRSLASYNILPNPEFLQGKHIGYFEKEKSRGHYRLTHAEVGSGDNFILELEHDAVYAMTIPGYHFTSNQYRLEIKALKEAAASTRSAGVVQVHYHNGQMMQMPLGNIQQTQWMIYKEDIPMQEDVHHVTILLNESTATRSGILKVDYVMLYPNPRVSEETTEIYEI